MVIAWIPEHIAHRDILTRGPVTMYATFRPLRDGTPPAEAVILETLAASIFHGAVPLHCASSAAITAPSYDVKPLPVELNSDLMHSIGHFGSLAAGIQPKKPHDDCKRCKAQRKITDKQDGWAKRLQWIADAIKGECKCINEHDRTLLIMEQSKLGDPVKQLIDGLDASETCREKVSRCLRPFLRRIGFGWKELEDEMDSLVAETFVRFADRAASQGNRWSFDLGTGYMPLLLHSARETIRRIKQTKGMRAQPSLSSLKAFIDLLRKTDPSLRIDENTKLDTLLVEVAPLVASNADLIRLRGALLSERTRANRALQYLVILKIKEHLDRLDTYSLTVRAVIAMLRAIDSFYMQSALGIEDRDLEAYFRKQLEIHLNPEFDAVLHLDSDIQLVDRLVLGLQQFERVDSANSELIERLPSGATDPANEIAELDEMIHKCKVAGCSPVEIACFVDSLPWAGLRSRATDVAKLPDNQADREAHESKAKDRLRKRFSKKFL